MKTYWLSFCAEDPSRFLGVAIVEVGDADAAAAKAHIDAVFPRHAPGAEWIAAATRKAHATGCNPGGQVAGWEIADVADPADRELLARAPRHVLLSRADLERLGLAPASLDEIWP